MVRQAIKKTFDGRSQVCDITILNDITGRVAQSVARLTQEAEVKGSIPGPATYFHFSFR